MPQSEGNDSRPSIQWKLSKLLLTAGLIAVLVLHVAERITLDTNGLAILGLIFLLWISPIIEELQISEYFRVRLKTAERSLALSELETMARLGQQGLRFLLPDWEFDLLQRIASDEDFTKDTNEGMDLFYKDLHHLIERGFIERVNVNTRIPSHAGPQNVHEYYRVTALGSEYIQMRNQPVPEAQDEQQDNV